jgi:hypothetical protein
MFSQLEGSKHISSEFALYGIEKLIKNKQINTIFEFGSGIGTIPYLIASLNKNCFYTGTETNEFCIKSLNKNLGEMFDSHFIKLIHNCSEYDGGKVDMLIIDGHIGNKSFIKEICHENTIIFIEGDRKEQREFIAKIYPKALINFKLSIKKNKVYSPFYKDKENPFKSGFILIRLNNNFSNKIQFFSDKVESFIKYKLRKLMY